MSFNTPIVKKIFSIVLLAVCMSCNSQQEKEVRFDTQTMNLKGNIKHITEKTGDHTWEFEFEDNKLLLVKSYFLGASYDMQYRLEYLKGKILQIHSKSSVVSPEIFSTNFAMRLPLYGFHNVQKLVRNQQGDVVRVFYKNQTPNEYTLKYTYDKFNNWTTRELYMQPGDYLKERTERTILYDRKVEHNEIRSWNSRLDSVFTAAQRRNEFIAISINNSIEKDYSKLNQINSYLNKNFEAVQAAEAYVNKLIVQFDSTYGKENLSKELQLLKDKMVILQSIAMKENFLWSEARVYIPMLISGEVSVKDVQEPYQSRTLITASLERISTIRLWEEQYRNK
ncbi:hypothetical protein [Flavobacterium sp. GSB-24]|uniref:hypothetical protein n=1 Tax=Flavobacterium sp. GSB-24 TaxID=2994319 RepID=UPI002492CC8E|nr:hypothetical protein [Flavobacterium sp. GSB-24]BDU26229.1 hypothetical protein FLGSB24_29730 [Flavobacterium sp. GSB-24]